MALGAALEILRLSRGCLDSFCPAGDLKRFLLVGLKLVPVMVIWLFELFMTVP
jgi:hypothetical protein